MAPKTINHCKAIDLFGQLLQAESRFRVLRLLGASKMGKSHLITKVFPDRARTANTLCAIVDLSPRPIPMPVSHFLHSACAQLGGLSNFTAFFTAFEARLSRSTVSHERLADFLSSTRPSLGDEGLSQEDLYLTTQFVADLSRREGRVVLLFDSINTTDYISQTWLMETLLVSLSGLNHIRVVVAGRAVPDAHGSYTTRCKTCPLQPVEDEAFIKFCDGVTDNLPEQSIRDMVRVFQHSPGLFVEFVLPAFAFRR